MWMWKSYENISATKSWTFHSITIATTAFYLLLLFPREELLIVVSCKLCNSSQLPRKLFFFSFFGLLIHLAPTSDDGKAFCCNASMKSNKYLGTRLQVLRSCCSKKAHDNWIKNCSAYRSIAICCRIFFLLSHRSLARSTDEVNKICDKLCCRNAAQPFTASRHCHASFTFLRSRVIAWNVQIAPAIFHHVESSHNSASWMWSGAKRNDDNSDENNIIRERNCFTIKTHCISVKLASLEVKSDCFLGGKMQWKFTMREWVSESRTFPRLHLTYFLPKKKKKNMNSTKSAEKAFSTCCSPFIRECLIKWFIDFPFCSRFFYRVCDTRQLRLRALIAILVYCADEFSRPDFNDDFYELCSSHGASRNKNELENLFAAIARI